MRRPEDQFGRAGCSRQLLSPPHSPWNTTPMSCSWAQLNALVTAHPSGKSLLLPGDLLPIFQEADAGVVNQSSWLHHLAPLFRLRKLAGPLQDIPLQQHDEFIWVSGVAEQLSSARPIGLAGDTVSIKR